MKTIGLLVLLFFGLITYSSINSHYLSVKPIIVRNDPGGLVPQEIMWIERLESSGVPVQIDGNCVSVCTFLLGLPHDQVCVTDKANLGFHAMFEVRTQMILRGPTLEMAKIYYPKRINEWFAKEVIGSYDKEAETNNGHVDNKPIYLDADRLVAMGVKHC